MAVSPLSPGDVTPVAQVAPVTPPERRPAVTSGARRRRSHPHFVVRHRASWRIRFSSKSSVRSRSRISVRGSATMITTPRFLHEPDAATPTQPGNPPTPANSCCTLPNTTARCSNAPRHPDDADHPTGPAPGTRHPRRHDPGRSSSETPDSRHGRELHRGGLRCGQWCGAGAAVRRPAHRTHRGQGPADDAGPTPNDSPAPGLPRPSRRPAGLRRHHEPTTPVRWRRPPPPR
jgi:hypothetical protein